MTQDKPTALAATNLFKPIKVGNVTLKNRLVHTPTTRKRNTESFVATDLMLQYYTDRAQNNGGLIIAEATFISLQGGLMRRAPGIWNKDQTKAWKKIVDAVHAEGSFMSSQFWHLGRMGEPDVLKEWGQKYIGPSAVYRNEESEKAAIDAGNELLAMTKEDIQQLKDEYINAADNAFEAGFDFIEVHAAHGYLFDQFLREATNKRTDEYGGSIENRARLLLEILDMLIEKYGAERVAVRLSPYVRGMLGPEGLVSHPIVTFSYVFDQLEKRAKAGNRLGYVSIVEPRVDGSVNAVNRSSLENNEWIFQIWEGVVLRAGAYLSDEGYQNLVHDVDLNDRTLIGVSRYYTSNPDLVERLKQGYPLQPYNRPTFYTSTNYGFNTWKKYGETWKDDAESEEAKRLPVSLV
ncbi:unnamed protein product [Kuraishia capsulata CBS 1993]|uniref:Probable NADPH dehydrogenase n=1 Tax=Kuraishia capsulata CBS 1993 TaxID=1382522 RepID=W6MP96_9ASCO|nr:uncharacterized protein KUCA_T00004084001 [Kuraishia capsulata CBS 1993]CDK28103.1 unnamed protein product [Kuraishia capsulata CBS 1993]